MRKLLVIAILMVFLVSPAQAHIVNYSWSAPADGEPVGHYEAEVQLAGGEWVPFIHEIPTNALALDQEVNTSYRLRVRGVSAEGVPGGWSEASVSYTVRAPGMCGRPFPVD